MILSVLILTTAGQTLPTTITAGSEAGSLPLPVPPVSPMAATATLNIVTNQQNTALIDPT